MRVHEAMTVGYKPTTDSESPHMTDDIGTSFNCSLGLGFGGGLGFWLSWEIFVAPPATLCVPGAPESAASE